MFVSFHDLQSSKSCHQEVDTHRATISAAFQVPVEALLAVTLISTSVPGPVTVPSQKDRVVPDCPKQQVVRIVGFVRRWNSLLNSCHWGGFDSTGVTYSREIPQNRKGENVKREQHHYSRHLKK